MKLPQLLYPPARSTWSSGMPESPYFHILKGNQRTQAGIAIDVVNYAIWIVPRACPHQIRGIGDGPPDTVAGNLRSGDPNVPRHMVHCNAALRRRNDISSGRTFHGSVGYRRGCCAACFEAERCSQGKVAELFVIASSNQTRRCSTCCAVFMLLQLF